MAALPPGKILVIQTAFLGDIVLSSGFLENLRSLAPKAEILFLTTPVGARILTPNASGIRMLSYDKRGRDSGVAGFLRLSRELRQFAPDLVFCLHRSLRSALLAKVSGGEIFGFREAAGSVLFSHRLPRPKELFEAEKNQLLLAAWAGERAKGQKVFPRLALSADDEKVGHTLLSDLGGASFGVFAPSSVWATKRWPADRFAVVASELWRRHRLRTVILGGSEEADVTAAAELKETCLRLDPSAPPPLNLAGKTHLGSLKAVMARGKILISNDSAPLHIGIAMGIPVVGVFGPTVRELGFFPNAPAGKAGVVELTGLSCRPCGLHGHDACPIGHFKCMLDLPPSSVLEEAEKLLCQ